MKKALVVNIGGRVANGLLPLFFLPIYFQHLGPESYGLYALLLSVQAILGFLDFGLSSSVTREFSRKALHENRATLFATFEKSHLTVGFVVAAIMLLLVWANVLTAENIKADLVFSQSGPLLMMCGLFLMAAWPLPFYSGALIGAELQIELNIINLLGNVFRYGGGWFILDWLRLGLSDLIALQALVSFGVVFLMRRLLLRQLPITEDAFRFDVVVLKRHAPYTIKLFGILLMGAFLSQADKFFLSSLLGLKTFGYYAIAGALASAVAVAVHPITSTYFPRFVQLHDVADVASMRRAFQSCALLIVCMVLAPSTVAIVQPEAVLRLWTQRGATDIGAAASFLPLLMLATHATLFMTLLQSVHMAGNRPHFIMLANLAQILILALGLGLASLFTDALLVLGTIVATPLLGVLILGRYLSVSVAELSWTVLIRPFCFVATIYVCALLSRVLVEMFGLTDPIGIVVVTLVQSMVPVLVAMLVFWRGQASIAGRAC